MSPDHRAEDPSSVVLDHQAAAEAAIMLIESVLLVLLETGILHRDRLVETVETVIEAKRELVADGIHPEISARAAGMLSVIANSVAAASIKRTP